VTRRLAAAALALTLASCTPGAEPTTTAAPPPPTTTTTTTTFPAPTTAPTTTTTLFNPAAIDYPANPATVADIPAELTAFIDAPMPDPDLSITGPEDLDRWTRGWLAWLAWVHANPAEGAEALHVNMLPGSEQFDSLHTALLDRAAAGQRGLGGGFAPVKVTGTFDQFFEDKTLFQIVLTTGGPPGYLVDEKGRVVSVGTGIEGEVIVSGALRYIEERDEWIMETFEVLGPA